MKLTDIIRKSTVALVVTVLFSCSNTYEEVNKVASDELVPFAESFDTEIIYTEEGDLESVLRAAHIQRYKREDSSWTLMPKGVYATFYNDTGAVDSEMESQYALWLQNRNVVIAEKDVVVKNIKGEQLNTERLVWYQDSGIFVTQEFVKITQPTGVIYGKGLRATENFADYEIQNITGNIAVEE